MKKPIILCTVCLLATLAVMFFGFRDTTPEAPVKSRTLTLLTQEDTGSFLLQLRYGAQAAAAEAGDKLTNTTPQPRQPRRADRGLTGRRHCGRAVLRQRRRAAGQGQGRL